MAIKNATKKDWKMFEEKAAKRMSEVCALCECTTWGIAFCANVGCPSGFEPYDRDKVLGRS